MLKSTQYCKCMCHINKSMHCFPCCFVCPNCGENIIKHYYSEHLTECALGEEKESKRITILAEGCEFDMLGAFTSDESLKAFKIQLPDEDLEGYKEYSIAVNPKLHIPEGKSVFRIEMRKDGTIVHNGDCGLSLGTIEFANSGEYVFTEVGGIKNLVICVWASDQKEAKEKVNEVRECILSKNLWGKWGKYKKKLDK